MKFWQWLFVLLVAIILAIGIRIFAFETVRVATDGMAKSQQVGNRLLVTKWDLGPRLPLSVGLPFSPDTVFGIPSYFITGQSPRRFYGKVPLKRNDVLVFNTPEDPGQPLDRRPVLISRCVGLPGDSLVLDGNDLFINRNKTPRHLDVSSCYGFSGSQLAKLRSNMQEAGFHREIFSKKDTAFVYLTAYEYLALRKIPSSKRVPLTLGASVQKTLNLRVPATGQELILSDSTVRIWGSLLRRYEGVKLKKMSDGKYSVDGKPTLRYRFKQNYYFVLNDHQGYLNDSRQFGPLPESHIIGKASLILFSPSSGRFLQKL